MIKKRHQIIDIRCVGESRTGFFFDLYTASGKPICVELDYDAFKRFFNSSDWMEVRPHMQQLQQPLARDRLNPEMPRSSRPAWEGDRLSGEIETRLRKLGERIDLIEKCQQAYGNARRENRLAKGRLRDAEAAAERARDRYARAMEWTAYYEAHIRPYISLFRSMTEDLGCFAACESSEKAQLLHSSMANIRDQLRFLLHRHDALFSQMEAAAVRPFPKELFLPDARVPDALQVGAKATLSDADSQLSDDFRRLQEYFRAGELLALRAEMAQLESRIAAVNVNALMNDTKKLEQETGECDARMEACREEATRTGDEAKKRLRNLSALERHWSFYLLLRSLLPFFREVAALEDEALFRQGVQLRARLLATIDQFNRDPSNGQLTFCWMDYTDLLGFGDSMVVLDYKVDAMVWPGLCAYPNGQAEKLFCVVPGHVPPAAM